MVLGVRLDGQTFYFSMAGVREREGNSEDNAPQTAYCIK
jgi:uncharacterized ParB-like nuclease family protein